MRSIETIRDRIAKLYVTHPDVHINISMTSPKVSVRNEPVRITGVYPHLFRIEEKNTGVPRSFTHRYTDLLTGRVEIAELGL